jgi:hypothetical protein
MLHVAQGGDEFATGSQVLKRTAQSQGRDASARMLSSRRVDLLVRDVGITPIRDGRKVDSHNLLGRSTRLWHLAMSERYSEKQRSGLEWLRIRSTRRPFRRTALSHTAA